jgi:hypothetical protein
MKTKTKWPEWLSKNDKLRVFFKKNKISNESAYEDFRVLGEPAYIDKIDLKRLDYYYDSLQDNPIQVLELSPFWVHFIEVNDLPANETTRNILSFHGINLVGDLMQYNRTRLLKLKYFHENILIQLSNSIYQLAIQNKKAISYDVVEERSWYEIYTKDNPLKVYLFNENDIFNENSYLKNRHKIPSKLINEIDEFRFSFLKNKIIDKNPINILEISPHWLLEMNIKYFRTVSKIKKIFKEQKIDKLRQLLECGLPRIKIMRGMNEKLMEQLHDDILHAKEKGAPPTYENPLVDKFSLLEGFNNTLNKIIDTNKKYILKNCLYLDDKLENFEEISVKLELKAGHARKIQREVIQEIIDEEFWDDSLKFKMQRLFKNNLKPILLEDLHINDPWFQGFKGKSGALQKIIFYFSHLNINFIEFRGKTLITDINKKQITLIQKKVINNLMATIDCRHKFNDIEFIIAHELKKINADSLLEVIFDNIFDQLHFAKVNNELILKSISFENSNRVKASLTDQKITKLIKPLEKTQSNNPVLENKGKTLQITKKNSNEDISKKIIKIIKDHRRPISTKMLEIEFAKVYGKSDYLFIHLPNINDIGRLGPDLWGLIARDFEGNYEYWDNIKLTILELIKQRKMAIHKSEILELISSNRIKPVPRLLTTIAMLRNDKRFKEWEDGYFILKNETSPKRRTIKSAIKKILADNPKKAYRMESLFPEVEKLVTHSINFQQINIEMEKLGYRRISNNKNYSGRIWYPNSYHQG